MKKPANNPGVGKARERILGEVDSGREQKGSNSYNWERGVNVNQMHST